MKKIFTIFLCSLFLCVGARVSANVLAPDCIEFPACPDSGDCSVYTPAHAHYVDGSCSLQEEECLGTCFFACDEGYHQEEGFGGCVSDTPTKYTCSTGYECVEDSEGIYESLEACESACVAPIPPPLSGGGKTIIDLGSDFISNCIAYVGYLWNNLKAYAILLFALPAGWFIIEDVIAIVRTRRED